MEETGSRIESEYQPLVGKIIFARPRHGCKDDIKINVQEQGE
jgi:hypothetical protein